MTNRTPPLTAVDQAMARLRAARIADQAFDDLGAPGWAAYQQQRARALQAGPPSRAALHPLAAERRHPR